MTADQETIEALRLLPALLRRLGSTIPTSSHRTCPAAGGFSLVEHACHPRDYEAEGIQWRIARILAEEDPVLGDFPGDRLAIERNDNADDFGRALNDFERRREGSLRQLAGLSDDKLARTTRFGSEGRVTLRDLIAIFAEHDVTHRQELDQLAGELAARVPQA